LLDLFVFPAGVLGEQHDSLIFSAVEGELIFGFKGTVDPKTNCFDVAEGPAALEARVLAHIGSVYLILVLRALQQVLGYEDLVDRLGFEVEAIVHV